MKGTIKKPKTGNKKTLREKQKHGKPGVPKERGINVTEAVWEALQNMKFRLKNGLSPYRS